MNAPRRIPFAVFAVALTLSTAHADPMGAIGTCLEISGICDKSGDSSAPRSAFDFIESVNRDVNARIYPRQPWTDGEVRSENRAWHIVAPGGSGACNEYALTKEFILSWFIPSRSMRLAWVRAHGDDHLILIVRIAGSDYVLDNLTPAIWPLDFVKTRYEFVEIQNADDGAEWSAAQ